VAGTRELIEKAVGQLQSEVPALAKLKLVVGLELRGRGDVQQFRVAIPGPSVSKGFAQDERLHVSIPRSHFNELAEEGRVDHWREAYEHGHIKVEGDPNIQKLIAKVIEHAEGRARLRKAH
jgi:hypothetical protein